MRKVLIAVMLFATPVAAAAAPQAEAAIKSAVGQIDTCIAKNDSKCLGALFADGATFSGPLDRGKLITGKTAIMRAFDEMMKEPGPKNVKQTRSVVKVRLIGTDRAFVDASVKLTGMKESADHVLQDWHSAMLMKLVDGKWLLEDVRYYVVATLPPPTPGPSPKPTLPAPTKVKEQAKPAEKKGS